MPPAIPAEVERAEQRLRRLCVELRQRLLAGENAATERMLASEPALAEDPESALELIYTEYVVREELADPLPAEAWQRRFPQWHQRLARLIEVHWALHNQAAADTAAAAATHAASETPSEGETATDLLSESARYEVLEEIGRGGTGVVYKARQAGLDRTVALKMILAGEFADRAERQRFVREAQLAARLTHPHIVHVYDVGELEGRPYLAMEYVAGGSLANRLAQAPLPPQVAARLVSVLARAIDHAHQEGVIHRDLKPANILLPRPDEDVCDCKIADFGLAKAATPSGAALPTAPSAAVLGTPSYMAPEQAGSRSQEIGARTDVYALGAILYEALTGRPPFQGNSPLETLEQVLALDPVAPSRLQPKTPCDLETICLKCLAKEPQRRYATAAALADDLDRHLAGQPIAARRVGLLERAVKWSRRRPAVASLLAALALTVVVSFAAIIAAWRSEADARERAETHLAAKLNALAEKQIVLAEMAWKGNDSAQAREYLAEIPTARRAERWFALERACTAQHWSWPVDTAVFDVAFDPAGKLAAATTNIGTLIIWDVASGEKRVNNFRAGPSASPGNSALQFTADGKQLVFACAHSSSKRTGVPDHLQWQFFDVATGKQLKRHTIRGGFSCVRLGQHGRYVLAGEKPADDLCIWNSDSDSGEPVMRLKTDYSFSDVAVTPDGKHVLVPGFDGVISNSPIADGLPIQRWTQGGTGYSPLDIAPIGNRCALGLHGNVVQVPLQVRDLTDGRILATIETPHIRINDVAMHPSGKWVASAGADGIAIVWDCISGREVLTLRGHTDSVESIEFSPDGKHLFTGGRDRTVRLWKFLPPVEQH